MVGGGSGWVRGRCVGRGSSAAVYLAASTSGERQSFFAVKSAELSRSAPLQREQNVLCSLCSPHVVSWLGADVTAEPDGRVLYNLFMEYVPGGSLAEAIKEHGGIGEHTIRVYARGILHGLAYLHGRGIVHCDVKAHNILLAGEDGKSVKLADLGCARWVDDGSDDGVVISGTPLYMAPEVARGEEQGPAADIWGLGCTVIEMATGCPPWRGVADPVAAIHRIAFSSDVPEFPCNVSDDATDFLGRCLERDPRKRWSAEELLNHPFVNCCEEFLTDCSPKSTLDRDFWDSWQEESEEEEEGEMDDQPLASGRHRLRYLVGGGFSAPLWDETCWITIRNSQNSESPSGEDEPSTSSRSWAAEAATLFVRGEEESPGYNKCTAVAVMEESVVPCDANNTVFSTSKIYVDEGKCCCRKICRCFHSFQYIREAVQ